MHVLIDEGRHVVDSCHLCFYSTRIPRVHRCSFATVAVAYLLLFVDVYLVMRRRRETMRASMINATVQGQEVTLLFASGTYDI